MGWREERRGVYVYAARRGTGSSKGNRRKGRKAGVSCGKGTCCGTLAGRVACDRGEDGCAKKRGN